MLPVVPPRLNPPVVVEVEVVVPRPPPPPKPPPILPLPSLFKPGEPNENPVELKLSGFDILYSYFVSLFTCKFRPVMVL